MAEDLEALRDSLSVSLEQLLDERDAAVAAGDMAKVTTAEAEAERIGGVLATVQFAISKSVALNLNAVAARLQESIEAQRGIGLSVALKTLADAVKDLKASVGGGPGTGGQNQPATGEIQAKPGKFQSVVNKLIAGAKARELEPMTVLTIVAIESDFDALQCSPLSSAAGLFQFIDSTWFAAGGEEFPGRGGRGNGHAAGASVDVQVAVGCKFLADLNKSLTKKLSSAPTRTALYMAHQQGLGGALKILKADPNSPIESVIGETAATNNAFGGLTVGQTIEKFRTMVRTNEDEANALVTKAAPTTGNRHVEISGNTIGVKAVNVGLSEMENFARRDGAILTETQSPLDARVLEYFRFVNRGDITDPTAEPWSAAFISFILDKAGATQTQFTKSAGHFSYILTGLANRIANRMSAPVVYFDRHEVAPRVGDLVGFSNTAKVKNRADMETFLPAKFFASHTDLVIDTSPGRIRALGGNVSQTIKITNLKADGDGRIASSEKHFFLLRLNI